MAKQKQIEIAAKLYECRDTAKRLLGANYRIKVAEYMEAVRLVKTKMKLDVLQAGIHLAKHTDAPIAIMMIMAATVEMIEPSGTQTTRMPVDVW